LQKKTQKARHFCQPLMRALYLQGIVMQFSEDELKMLSWLKTQHKGWKSTRVIILVSSILMMSLSLYCLYYGIQPLAALILFGGSAGGLSYSLAAWSGRAEVSLLLKLIEHHKEET